MHSFPNVINALDFFFNTKHPREMHVHVFAVRCDWKLIVAVLPSLVSGVVISKGVVRVHTVTSYEMDGPWFESRQGH